MNIEKMIGEEYQAKLAEFQTLVNDRADFEWVDIWDFSPDWEDQNTGWEAGYLEGIILALEMVKMNNVITDKYESIIRK